MPGSPGGDHGTTEYKAFIGGIPWTMDDEGLRELFSAYGADRAEVMLDRHTNRSRGFGFVIFRDREGLDSAIRDKHDSDLDGRKISVKSAIPQDQIPPGERGRQRAGGRPGDRGYGAYGRSDPYGGGYGGGGGGGYGGYRGGYDRGYDRGGYDRGGYDRGGYDRGGYGGYGGGGYGGGYDRGGYGYGGGYDRDPYYGRGADPYAGGGYGGYGAPAGYGAPPPGGGGGGYGPDRGARAYTQPRADPYARPR